MHASKVDRLKPYSGGVWEYAQEAKRRCIHNATPLDCERCGKLITSDTIDTVVSANDSCNTSDMTIQDIEHIIEDYRRKYKATTNDEAGKRDRLRIQMEVRPWQSRLEELKAKQSLPNAQQHSA
jgi:hypothetical protein